jgi:hypothetical protein
VLSEPSQSFLQEISGASAITDLPERYERYRGGANGGPAWPDRRPLEVKCIQQIARRF